MGHFYVWKFSKQRRIMTVIVIALLCALIIYLKPFPLATVFSTVEETSAITSGDDKEKNVSLTFNISWGDEKVHDILDVLKKQKVKATFFVSGEWAEKNPHILEKIAEDQHEIGMLGYRYESYIDQEIEAVKQDVRDAIQIFNKLGFDHISYIRPPSGHFNKEVLEVIEKVGLQAVHWRVHPNDWENPGVDTIVSHLTENVVGGDIILMHASDSAKQTAEALQQGIPSLQDKDIDFVTLSELLDGVSVEDSLIE